MERLDAIELLKALWQEAHDLAVARSIMSEAFHNWHERTLTALRKIYGSDSSELREFAAIRYDLDTGLLDTVERTMRDLATAQDIDLSDTRIDLAAAQERRYEGRLADAAELLLTFVVGLRQEQ